MFCNSSSSISGSNSSSSSSSSSNSMCFKVITVVYIAVAQLVKTVRYKPEGRGFDSRWCHWNFSMT